MYADQFQSLINDVKRKKVNEDNGKHKKRKLYTFMLIANHYSIINIIIKELK